MFYRYLLNTKEQSSRVGRTRIGLRKVIVYWVAESFLRVGGWASGCISFWKYPMRSREVQIGLGTIGGSSFFGPLPWNVEIVSFHIGMENNPSQRTPKFRGCLTSLGIKFPVWWAREILLNSLNKHLNLSVVQILEWSTQVLTLGLVDVMDNLHCSIAQSRNMF